MQDVYWTDLEPAKGGKTQKIRPGLIFFNDIGNETSKIVMIAPITGKIFRIHPFEVGAIVDARKAKIMLNQCRAIDKSRLGKKICEIDSETMKTVEESIKLFFGIS